MFREALTSREQKQLAELFGDDWDEMGIITTVQLLLKLLREKSNAS
jgi:hypothetical protein